jgi:hypothetical protein
MEMHNPLRSERDVFRAVVAVGAGAAAVIALALLTRPAFGAALLVVEAVLGAWTLWRRARDAPTTDVGSRSSRETGEP